jgi:hypothetical protein
MSLRNLDVIIFCKPFALIALKFLYHNFLNFFWFGRTNGLINQFWDLWFECPQDSKGCKRLQMLDTVMVIADLKN